MPALKEFDLDGKKYELHANNGHHHLHGGKEGFNRKWWAVVESTATQLTLALRSPDGDEGYPGTVDVRVTYSLPTENTLKIEMATPTLTTRKEAEETVKEALARLSDLEAMFPRTRLCVLQHPVLSLPAPQR